MAKQCSWCKSKETKVLIRGKSVYCLVCGRESLIIKGGEMPKSQAPKTRLK